ncbi:MAG TPA: hydrolase Nlp/P60, partial [Coriobacteriia bacterium]|nr:hydrolase Nlp/P60 [Coriobacteriia bacterium]
KARHDAISAQVADTEARLAGLTARQGELVGNLAVRAVGMYRQGPLGALEVLLGSTTFEEFAATWDLLQDMNDNDAARIAELKQVRAQVSETQARLSVQQEEAAVELADMEARKSEVEAQLAERNRVLAGIKAEIAAILREQAEAERRRAAAAAAAARASISTAASRSEVVRIALSKLGSPYKWAAAGPDSFD